MDSGVVKRRRVAQPVLGKRPGRRPVGIQDPVKPDDTHGSHSSSVENLTARDRRSCLMYAGALAVFGVVATLIGLIYGAVLVGVPSQDPTPEMAQREAFHVSVSSWIMAIGGCLFAVGVVAALFVWVSRSGGTRRNGP